MATKVPVLNILRTADGLRIDRPNVEDCFIELPLAVDDSITRISHLVDAEDGKTEIVIGLANKWESFTGSLGWNRREERTLRFRTTSYGLEILQGDDWFSIEGLDGSKVEVP